MPTPLLRDPVASQISTYKQHDESHFRFVARPCECYLTINMNHNIKTIINLPPSLSLFPFHLTFDNGINSLVDQHPDAASAPINHLPLIPWLTARIGVAFKLRHGRGIFCVNNLFILLHTLIENQNQKRHRVFPSVNIYGSKLRHYEHFEHRPCCVQVLCRGRTTKYIAPQSRIRKHEDENF